MKVNDQYIPVVLFIMLYDFILIFEMIDEIPQDASQMNTPEHLTDVFFLKML